MRITKSNQEKRERKVSKMNLKNLKKKIQGITLIALVVTVIVLLILAGVAINLTVGDNGLFRRAQNAADTWQMAEQNEQSELKNMESLINGYQYNIDIPQVEDKNAGVLEEVDDNTLEIQSIEDLVVFSYNVKNGNGYDGKIVRLAYNLDFNSDKSYVDPMRRDYEEYGYEGPLKVALTSGAGFEPIGIAGGNSFRGVFDGNNNCICSLYENINSSEVIRIGLFGVNSGEIRNLGLINCNINIKCATTTIVGGVTAINAGNLINCHTDGKINVDMQSGWGIIGGICGAQTNNGTIEKCSNNIELDLDNNGEIGEADISCGGIVGQNNDTNPHTLNINECYNRAKISAHAENVRIVAGGILGSTSSLSQTQITNSYNTGKIEVTGKGRDSNNPSSAGGILGDVCNSIINCYNLGEIFTDSQYAYIGGVVGFRFNNLQNVINLGTVIAKGENGENIRVGGINGRGSGTMENVYNIGKVTLDNSGGLIGAIIGGRYIQEEYNFINCKYLKGSASNAIGDNYIFDGIEEIDDIEQMPIVIEVINSENVFKEDNNNINNGYPILSWQ